MSGRGAWPAVALCVAGAVASCSPAGPRRGDGGAAGAAPSGARDAGADGAALGPAVAVGLSAGAARVTIDADGALGMAGPERAGQERSVRAPCVATRAGSGVSVRCADGARHESAAAMIRFRRLDGTPLRVDGREYDGEILVRAGEDGLTTINTLALETYLLGVVPHEIGARPAAEIEAVKAQAVAARTYAIAHRGRRAALGFDYWGDVNDQVYRGREGQDAVAARAVRETRGEILTHQGQPILAFYHSTCGGRTAAIDEVWRRGPLPYLRSVSDLREDGSAWCETSNRFRWSQRWSWDELGGILERTIGLPRASLREVRVRSRTPSGRVSELEIEGDGRRWTVFGDSLRWALRPQAGRILNSALIFDLEEGTDVHGRYLEARGGGWGHGIGMCQVGAMARARAGQTYRRILAAYYTGTDLERTY